MTPIAASEYAVTTQPISSNEAPRFPPIVGSATLTIVESRNCMTAAIATPRTITTNRDPCSTVVSACCIHARASRSAADLAAGRPTRAMRCGATRAHRRTTRRTRTCSGSAIRRQRSFVQYVYTMFRVGKTVPPKRQILKDISLSFFPGAKIGILGLNGAGKSTVLRIMAGVDQDFDGEATPMPGITTGWLPQEPVLDPDKTVRETVEEALTGVFAARKRLDAIYAAYGEPDADFEKLAEEQAKLEAELFSQGGDDVEQQLEIAADALRLPPWDARIGPLSGGEKRRVALCRLLLAKPDMLLLDEPTNHLDAESVEWLEQFLQRFPGTVVAVTHDRYFL